jgi:hypothetical protein
VDSVLENMGVTGERVDWMAEYAEFHSINENAYVNASNVSGMGAVIAAQPSALAGQTIGNTITVQVHQLVQVMLVKTYYQLQ